METRDQKVERIRERSSAASYDPECEDIGSAQLQTACRIVAQCLQLGIEIPETRLGSESKPIDVAWINRNWGAGLGKAREKFLKHRARQAEQEWDLLDKQVSPGLSEDIRFFLKVHQRRLAERVRAKLGR